MLNEKLLARKPHELLLGITTKISDGTHFTPNYTDEGIPFLSALNVLENRLDLEVGHRLISLSQHQDLYRRCDPKPDDVLLRKVGVGPRLAAVVPDDLPEFSIFVSVAQIRLRDTSQVRPTVLSTFINSQFGQEQLLRLQKGASQPDLHLEDIRRLVVPEFGNLLQESVEQRIKTAKAEWKHSHAFYIQAETLLLDALGLRDWQPPQPLTYESTFKGAFVAGRLDAEHFQPQYAALVQQLQKCAGGCMQLGELCPYPVNGVEVREYEDEGVPYLRVGDIQHFSVKPDSVVYINPKDAAREIEKVRLIAGDVLVSRSGSLGVIGVVEPAWTEAVISSHLIRVRLENEEFDPYYVAAFLSSRLGKMQIKQHSNGGVQPEINQPALKSIFIPKLTTEQQSEIRAGILAGHTARRRAKGLLESAKRAVEIAIETDESTALAYLEANK